MEKRSVDISTQMEPITNVVNRILQQNTFSERMHATLANSLPSLSIVETKLNGNSCQVIRQIIKIGKDSTAEQQLEMVICRAKGAIAWNRPDESKPLFTSNREQLQAVFALIA
ncbi:MAG TPA: hypothetical protein IGS53_11695 [Leptolyngbyaceae cyanobacterium M33_DOE_097]|uniref:Uncharacterized protein n=1 Tax=Oscillatoriales cyanobacterium SpSt-418 TaxID=2282169 RepID=A0A7C3PDH2_9CYAN|nr:hypothetical protein [Leptolyngbyaceae cyanobacterium M33_DOE_097]